MSNLSFESILAEKNFRHVTIRQVLNAITVDDRFCIGDQETGFVEVIANVYNIDYNGSRLTYGLDDGTGRIRASKWDVGTEEGEVETMRHRQPFQYVRAVGEINQFRGLLSLRLESTRSVKDPHEIYHHLLRVMLETVICQRGPPNIGQSPTAVESHHDPLSMQSLHDSLSGICDSGTEDPPMSRYNFQRIDSTQGERSPRESKPEPQREGRPQPSKPIQPSPTRAVGSIAMRSPWSQLNDERNFQYDNMPIASTSRGTPSSQGNPSLRRKHLTETNRTERSPTSTPERRMHDPYSHLSNLHRDIILTIQNILLHLPSKENWRGVSLAVLAKAIAKRRPYLKPEQLLEAVRQLVDEGYLYNTIDENTFACT